MPRIAAIDAGSNALRMMIADVDAAGRVKPIRNLRLPVRLGQDVFASGALKERTIRRATDAFRQFRRLAKRSGVTQIRAIATSALREASNRDDLLERIARRAGIRLEVISAAEEARLIHVAVSRALHLKNKPALLVDIGGGSVEVSLTRNGRVASTQSYPLGAVRLLAELGAKKVRSAPTTLAGLVREYAEPERRRIHRQIGRAHINVCAATGGTAEDLGRLVQLRFNTSSDNAITAGRLQQLIDLLEDMNLKQRMRKLALRADRADVILPAAVILQLIAREAGVRRVVIPHVGLKDGVLIEMAEAGTRSGQARRRAQVIASAHKLGRKYSWDAPHALRTARLALQLFDQGHELHSLGTEERLILEVAALLHDLGRFIDSTAHERHGAYILESTPLIGLSLDQRLMAAELVRYHRRGALPVGGGSLARLSRTQQTTVAVLAALLRLAVAMDASRSGHVRLVHLRPRKRRWQLSLQGRGDLRIERLEVERRRALFEKVFGLDLEVKAGS